MNKRFLPAYLLTFVNTLGASVLMPVLPFIVEEYGAPKWVFGLLITTYSVFQFFGASLLGAISDHKGRKPVLLISHVGTLLSWFIFIGALYIVDIRILGLALPLIIIGISRMVDGLTGGNTSVANAYVADITTRKEKGYIFGYLGGISGIAIIIGPGLGGLSASGPLGHVGTGLLAIGISTITLFAIYFGLKESLPPEKRVKKPQQSIADLINIPKHLKALKPSPALKVLFTSKLFFTAMMGSYMGSVALFIIDLFDFDEKELGLFMFVVGAFLAFNQAFVTKIFINKFGEMKTLMLGLFLTAFGLIAFTLTDNLYLFIACYYFLNLGFSLAFPTFNALISTHADEEKKGEVLGISESIGSLSLAIFPFLSSYAYTHLGSSWFYVVALMPLSALVISLVSMKKIGAKAFE